MPLFLYSGSVSREYVVYDRDRQPLNGAAGGLGTQDEDVVNGGDVPRQGGVVFNDGGFPHRARCEAERRHALPEVAPPPRERARRAHHVPHVAYKLQDVEEHVVVEAADPVDDITGR